jgi:uncharacterized membrane protein
LSSQNKENSLTTNFYGQVVAYLLHWNSLLYLDRQIINHSKNKKQSIMDLSLPASINAMERRHYSSKGK